MSLSSVTILRGGAFSAALMIGSGIAHAGCTANLTPDRELNVRSGPSTTYQPVGRIPGQACGIRIDNCDDGWCRVSYRGLDGYSSDFYLRKTDRAEGFDERRIIRQWWNVAKAAFADIVKNPDWERLGSVEVGRERDRSVIQLDRRDGRFDMLRMRVRGADVDFRRVVVVYGNGRRHNLKFGKVVDAGGETGEIELRGNQGRFIDRIILVHEKAQHRGRRAEVEVWARKAGGGRDERRERIGFGPKWDRLATKTVDRRRDRDVIELNRKDGRFDALGLRVLDNDLRIRRMRVEYGNGVAHDLDVDKRVNGGDRTGPIELRGQNGRFIDRVVLVYDTVGRGPRAKVELWGRKQ